MYSDQTYEVIKNRTLENINLDIYKGEGSFLNNMISGNNLELSKIYLELSKIHKMAFIQDTYNQFLDKRVNEFGVYRKLGTESNGEVEFIGENGVEISNGTIISYKDLSFVVIKDIVIGGEEGNISPVEALEIGTRYNLPSDCEFKVNDNIFGIEKITNINKFSGGTEIETDEELRERFLEYKNQATSGNKAHYEEWALEVDGVYNAKVYPRWNGAGTVKVLLFGQNNQAVEEEIITKCREHIEEEMPIGATLTVTTPIPLNITISASMELESGYTLDMVKNSFIENINQYFRSITGEIVYTKIMGILISTSGVHDLSNLLVNNSTDNITINEDKIPSVTTVNFSEVENQ
ncbi:baseplate J/gp47 family protein [Clostridioides difficile]|uniref:baseplate J/gp47 family protein n=1 Tax=Clostridioides difficile TaxID=1496 RepID=UPI001AF62805|nr:baseplate J/gp47 family protein [Clostridioides difficile]QQY52415.1 baseplate J/gp47 family protein [Clostridioides difficile]